MDKTARFTPPSRTDTTDRGKMPSDPFQQSMEAMLGPSAAVQQLLKKNKRSAYLLLKAYSMLFGLGHAKDERELYPKLRLLHSIMQGMNWKADVVYHPEFRERLHQGESFLFVSPHANICMDPFLIRKYTHRRTDSGAYYFMYSVIGDNLMKGWAKDFLTLCGSISFARGRSGSDMMRDVVDTLTLPHTGIWIASSSGIQKNGRMEMSALVARTLTRNANLRGYSVVPVGILYEMQPNLAYETRVLLSEFLETPYEKSEGDDLKRMLRGVFPGYPETMYRLRKKHRIRVRFGQPILLEAAMSTKDFIRRTNRHFCQVGHFEVHEERYHLLHAVLTEGSVPPHAELFLKKMYGITLEDFPDERPHERFVDQVAGQRFKLQELGELAYQAMPCLVSRSPRSSSSTTG